MNLAIMDSLCTDALVPKIPKIIHYIWVGGQPMPKVVLRCIESWKKFAPDYEIRFWDEKNSPMEHPYVQAMYVKGKWAFVSDYIRFWALEREGGIYLDTDMELLKPLDRFLSDGAFLGRSKSGHIESSIIGVTPHHPLVIRSLAFYEHDTEYSIQNTSPLVIERIVQDDPPPTVAIYGPEYFHPCDEGERCSPNAIGSAHATHHWAESWVPFARTRKFARRLGVMPMLKKLMGR